MKSWNIRDQSEETLKRMLEKKYKDIDRDYRMLKRLSSIEDAKIMIEEIWDLKSIANSIELELMRRECNDGIS